MRVVYQVDFMLRHILLNPTNVIMRLFNECNVRRFITCKVIIHATQMLYDVDGDLRQIILHHINLDLASLGLHVGMFAPSMLLSVVALQSLPLCPQ